MIPVGSSPRYTADQRAAMVRLYVEELLSLPEIARVFGCHHGTVRLALEAAGIPRRTPAEQRASRHERLRRALTAPPPATRATTPGDIERIGDTLQHIRRLIAGLSTTAAATDLGRTPPVGTRS